MRSVMAYTLPLSSNFLKVNPGWVDPPPEFIAIWQNLINFSQGGVEEEEGAGEDEGSDDHEVGPQQRQPNRRRF